MPGLRRFSAAAFPAAAVRYVLEEAGVALADVDSDGTLDVGLAAQRLGMPVIHDAQHGVYSVGAATLSGHTLSSAEAADPELQDRHGNPFRLSSLRGRKVVLVAWSTY